MWFLPKNYVWVNTRIEQFHEKYKKWSIETLFEINGNIVIFTAKVSLWEENRVFTGHSFGTVWKEKAFEKLETVAVGRALAFAWFETKEWIASREEMEVFDDSNSKEVSKIDDIIVEMYWVKSMEWLKKLFLEWMKLNPDSTELKRLETVKDQMKSKFV